MPFSKIQGHLFFLQIAIVNFQLSAHTKKSFWLFKPGVGEKGGFSISDPRIMYCVLWRLPTGDCFDSRLCDKFLISWNSSIPAGTKCIWAHRSPLGGEWNKTLAAPKTALVISVKAFKMWTKNSAFRQSYKRNQGWVQHMQLSQPCGWSKFFSKCQAFLPFLEQLLYF